MNTENLNLARKLRPKNFDQIVGQDLCVRILKNGLYLNTFFPVYLFSGQRGCGKTTSARVFAASINCEKLADFQKNPKQPIPCYECKSCEYMVAGKHPDFIEIDAASHTGVDNVRQIIESSSFLPLMGRKKIYLIDEAHMLSKAAFNAFLKILEEPPATVLFILATTDVQRIIDTVRSRSFQIFFSAIDQLDLLEYLKEICKNESINYEVDGLKIIIKESQGSARDAINLLEQVKFSSNCITKDVVLTVLGHISDEHLLSILEQLVLQKNPQDFINLLDSVKFSGFSPEYIFTRFNEILNIAIRMKYGVISKVESALDIQKKAKEFALDRLLFIAEEIFKAEFLFLKTINKHLFLELLFLRLLTATEPKKVVANKITVSNDTRQNAPQVEKTKVIVNSVSQAQSTYNGLNAKKKENSVAEPVALAPFDELRASAHGEQAKPYGRPNPVTTNEWDMFLQEIKNNNDQLLISIFSQAQYQSYDLQNSKVTIALIDSAFFRDALEEKSKMWEDILNKVYGKTVSLKIDFYKKTEVAKPQVKPQSENTVEKSTVKSFDKQIVNQGSKVDISDKSKWQSANMLLDSFPGVIEEIRDEQ